MPGIPSEDACFFGGTPRNYALTLFQPFHYSLVANKNTILLFSS